MFDFDELEEIINRLRIAAGAAESHGFLSGYLCLSDDISKEVIQEYLLANTEIDSDGSTLNEYHALFTNLAEEVSNQMAAPEFDFQLLLPDDDSSISHRTKCLAEWCQGFLSGIGVVGNTNWQGLSSECHDVINDFYKICRLSADDEQEDDEEAEQAFFELVEYVRMGTLLIHDEFALLNVDQEQPEVLH